MRLPFVLAALLLLALSAAYALQRRVRGRFMAASTYALFGLALLAVALLEPLARYRPLGWWVLGLIALLVLLRGGELALRTRRRG